MRSLERRGVTIIINESSCHLQYVLLTLQSSLSPSLPQLSKIIRDNQRARAPPRFSFPAGWKATQTAGGRTEAGRGSSLSSLSPRESSTLTSFSFLPFCSEQSDKLYHDPPLTYKYQLLHICLTNI